MAPEQMPQVSDEPLTMCNTLMITRERREDYLTELRAVLPLARRLPACLSLDAGEVDGRSGTIVLFERWRSGTEYVNEIFQLDFYQRYLERTEEHYAAPRFVLVLQPVN